MTQKVDVIEYLKNHGSITRMEAFLELGVCELPARIIELEHEGFVIPRTEVKVPARNGRQVKVTRYERPTVWP